MIQGAKIRAATVIVSGIFIASNTANSSMKMALKLEYWQQKIFHSKKTKNQINNFQCFISYD